MNSYSTELRRAMTLADQILALKQNRSLSEADAIQVDAGAFFPAISRWTQLCGFRMSGPPEAGKALLLAPADIDGISTLKRNGLAMDRLYGYGYQDGTKLEAFLNR